MKPRVELLAPAGCEKNFYAAINNGANAVYLGLDEFSARRNAGNFTLERLAFFVSYAHAFDVKVYVAVNTLIKRGELEKFFSLVGNAADCGVDAFIVQDVFLGRPLKKLFPNIELHLSTQAGVCNESGARFAVSHGFTRVILARETPILEIEKICKIADTEVFVHGALCTCFSGHCYLSSFIGGNSGNRGLCRQPCRKLYKYEGENIKDELRYALSLADLNLSKKIDKLIDVGVKSFKIEGRMRSFEYVCASCDFYNELLSGNFDYKKAENLKRAYNRGDYTEGLCFGQKSDLISDKIQNHCGSSVGTVISANGKYLNVAFNKYTPKADDCYKIVFNKKESGNAVAVACESLQKSKRQQKNQFDFSNNGIAISYRGFAAPGSFLNITKDVALLNSYESASKKTLQLDVFLKAKIGEPLSIDINDKTFISDYVVQSALTCVTTKSEIKENLRKIDVYPFVITPKVESDSNIFIRKKALNELRSRAYNEYFYSFSKNVKRNKIAYNTIDFKDFYDLTEAADFVNAGGKNVTVLLCDEYPRDVFLSCGFTPNYVVYCPSDYSDKKTRNEFLTQAQRHNCEVKCFLYVPAFYSIDDEKLISELCDPFFGLYVESSAGIYLSKRLKKEIFSGIEMNITNPLSAEELTGEGLFDYSVSKELSYSEAEELSGYKLCLGDIKVMSLQYCPFGKKCIDCKRKNLFYLLDGDKRKFKVRRYKLSSCRFEIFNESELKSKMRFTKEIFDFSACSATEIYTLLADFYGIKHDFSQKNSYNKKISVEKIKYTSGNLLNGMN